MKRLADLGELLGFLGVNVSESEFLSKRIECQKVSDYNVGAKQIIIIRHFCKLTFKKGVIKSE